MGGQVVFFPHASTFLTFFEPLASNVVDTERHLLALFRHRWSLLIPRGSVIECLEPMLGMLRPTELSAASVVSLAWHGMARSRVGDSGVPLCVQLSRHLSTTALGMLQGLGKSREKQPRSDSPLN